VPVPTFQSDALFPVCSNKAWSILLPALACRHADEWRAWMGDRLRRTISSGHYADRQNAIRDVWNDTLLL
jgi:hypothetical protein